MQPIATKEVNDRLRYIVYCDESSSQGDLYVDFFGGCIIDASKIHLVEDTLNDLKQSLNLKSEIKWTNVSEPYLEKYKQVIHAFFDYVRAGVIKVRIMFRKRSSIYPHGRMPVKEERYFKLYYQFIKHSFGFRTPSSVTGDYHVAFLLDELPDHSAQADAFKRFLHTMPSTKDFEGSGLHINEEDIGEVDSQDHVILQCVDIVLGAMFFRMNKLNEVKEPVTGKRGKRTKAKEKLYQMILGEIRTIHPVFNIGVSTGDRGYTDPHWNSPYEHWLFEPKKLV